MIKDSTFLKESYPNSVYREINNSIEFTASDSFAVSNLNHLSNKNISAPPKNTLFDKDITAESSISKQLDETEFFEKACKIAEIHIHKKFEENFIQVIHKSNFEFGFHSQADEFVQQALKQYGVYARDWINDLFIRKFDDSFLLSSILRVIAHFDYNQMYPQGITMAIAATTHSDIEVRECGIRCFESWEKPDNLRILRKLTFTEGWLNEYLQDVIRDLEKME
ncbi:hypothetical protein GF373_12745 [bacterium]|nr:hypothetical protein [bacterium]